MRSPPPGRRGSALGCPRPGGRPRRPWPARRRRLGRRRRSTATSRHWAASSHPNGATAVEAERVVGSLHAERHRAGVDGGAEGVDARVARWELGPAGAHHDVGPELPEAFDDGVIGGRWHVHVEGPPDGGGQRGRRQCRVPARRDGEAAPCPREQTEALGRFEVQQHAHEVAGLVGPGHAARLVLHPDAPVGGEAEGVGQAVLATRRRHPEAGAIDGGDGGVDLPHEGDGVAIGHAVRGGEGVPRHASAVGDEGVGVVVGWRRRRGGTPGGLDAQDVGPVVRRCVRAPPRARRRDRNRGGTDRAAVAEDHDGARTRALKSSIISSHTPR